jgi:hypothetical protein
MFSSPGPKSRDQQGGVTPGQGGLGQQLGSGQGQEGMDQQGMGQGGMGQQGMGQQPESGQGQGDMGSGMDDAFGIMLAREPSGMLCVSHGNMLWHLAIIHTFIHTCIQTYKNTY